ncbi:MAG: phosphatase PAP2 family protein, partial [Thermomicrobiales bacterium]
MPLSRRTLVGAGAIAALGWHSGLTSTRAMQPAPARPVGAWSTWLLASGSELRPAAPSAVTAGEVAELLQLQSARDDRSQRIVSRWGHGPSVLPWTSLALDLIEAQAPSPVRASRALALLHVALHDAVIASWDARVAFQRPPPAVTEPAITPLDTIAPEDSSYPSEHAAVASAAALVLAYLFPETSARWLATLAEEAGFSRLRAGTNYRSDVEAGFALGRMIGARAVTRGEGDGSAASWDGSGRPDGDGYWQPTPPGFAEPLDPLAGAWQPWVLATGSAFRPAAAPAYQSPAWHAELAAVQQAVAMRTAEQAEAAQFWAGGPGTVTPAGLWTRIASNLIVRDGLDGAH